MREKKTQFFELSSGADVVVFLVKGGGRVSGTASSCCLFACCYPSRHFVARTLNNVKLLL
jgi:hypothetical protein